MTREWTCQREGCEEHGIQGAGGPPRKWCSGRCRKIALYAGACRVCGAATNGSNGGSAPDLCFRCCRRENMTWSPEVIVQWIRDHARDGVAPDARSSAASCSVVSAAQREFGSWSAAVEAAGFTPRAVGERIDVEAWKARLTAATRARFAEGRREFIEMWMDGVSISEIARRRGVTPLSVSNMASRLRAEGVDLPRRYRGKAAA